MGGAFLIPRDLLNHPALDDRRDPKWCRRAVFLDLMALAAYAPRAVNVAGRTVHLERGQLCYSTRFLAMRWGWSESGVRRFFNRLIADALIDAATDAGQTLVTIRKYDEMQRFAKSTDALIDAPDDARVTRERRTVDANKNEGNESNERNSSSDKTVSTVAHGGSFPGFVVAKSADVGREIARQAYSIKNGISNGEHWPNNTAVDLILLAAKRVMPSLMVTERDRKRIASAIGDPNSDPSNFLGAMFALAWLAHSADGTERVELFAPYIIEAARRKGREIASTGP